MSLSFSGGMPTYGAESSSSKSFPNFNIPESEKDEEYHKQYVEAISYSSINSSYDLDYSIMDESYEYYDGTQGGEEFNFLQEAADGEILPAQWINFNKIRTKVDLQLGELEKKSYSISVRAINKEAIIRKKELKDDMRIDMRLNPVAKEFEKAYSVPLGYKEGIPETEEELDMKFDSFQDKTEVVMEYALKFLDKKYKWRYCRIALFRDILIAGRCFIKTEIVGGYPTYRRIDPRNIIFDKEATDDFLSDATYFGEVRYMSIVDAAQVYNLSVDEIKDVYKSYKNNEIRSAKAFNVSATSSLKFFDDRDGELRCLVVSAYWQDYKKLKKKFSVDKYGNEHVKEVPDTKQDSEEVKSKLIKTWRQGTLIGGKILKQWGEIDNQVRSIDDWFESSCPIKGCVPNFVNKRSVSNVHILKALQKLKNITMYNIQLAMARAGAKGFVYDVSQIPDEWDLRTVIKYLKVAGIAFIDSQKNGIPAQYNQFTPIDQTISNGVQHYLEINAMIDREMDNISGINEARQGQMMGASQSVGVTQAALVQSNITTETRYAIFQMFASSMWTHLAGLVKLAWANKEKFSPIVGETGIDFLSNELDLELDDYAVFVEEINPIFQDVQMFQQLVSAALQAQQISFLDALKLMREKDVTKGIREFEKAQARRQKEAAMQQQQSMMQQHQLDLEREQAIMQGQAQANQVAAQGKLQDTSLKSNADLQKTAVKGRIDLKGKQIDLLGQDKKLAVQKEIEHDKIINKPKPSSGAKK